MRYRKKPVEVDAVRFVPENWHAICMIVGDGGFEAGITPGLMIEGEFVKAQGRSSQWLSRLDGESSIPEIALLIPTLEGDMLASEGDYLIRGTKGEFYPCKPDIFVEIYEEA